MRPYDCVIAALVVLGTPALAATDTNSASKSADSGQKAAPSPDHKYCIASDGSASDTRIYTRECRTKAEWAKRGVDIDELQKKQ